MLIDPTLVESGTVRLMSESHIPFSDQSIDLVYCRGVLHHIPFNEIAAMLTDIKRVLRPKGCFVFIEPRLSIFRSIGHWLVIASPLRHIGQFGTLRECLINEWETYIVWLRRWKREIESLCLYADLTLSELNLRPLTVVGIARKNS